MRASREQPDPEERVTDHQHQCARVSGCGLRVSVQAMNSLTQKNESLTISLKKSQQQLKEALAASDKASLVIKDLKREV
jgi:hypothetical protein